MESSAFPPRTSDSASLSAKLEAPPSPPVYPPRNMEMPYGQRPLPEHPMGYSNYSPGSFPPSSGPYGPPPVSFASLPPSFTPSSLAPSLSSTPGFPPSGATGSPPLEAFVQLLLAMNVEDQLKVTIPSLLFNETPYVTVKDPQSTGRRPLEEGRSATLVGRDVRVKALAAGTAAVGHPSDGGSGPSGGQEDRYSQTTPLLAEFCCFGVKTDPGRG
ncbi:hypothetical protein Hamer_G020183 [Homarus americanus]|uniref:Uncharacterized protein n=1 Tax=Homarus americanus TaxID=6706 RepID=A0A8J5MSN0_HOMAM|nr:hypothetical protein Hamer_G020183 [Homarus americanus]